MVTMFTGIIEATAEVVTMGGGKLTVRRPPAFRDVSIGSSICVSGACLTVTELTEAAMTFDVVPETLSKTTLGSKKEGDSVNLERALAASGRFEGHVVQGHVEGVGEVGVPPSTSHLTISLPRQLLPFVVSKGSITLDGVSLTVASVEHDLVTVAIIPHTLAQTTLGSLRKDDRVNVETDILARVILRGIPSAT